MFPTYLKPVSLLFRKRRNRRLVAMIERLWRDNERPVSVLDVGGSLVFWLSIPESARQKCDISLINLPGAYEGLPPNEARLRGSFSLLIGDARDLSRFADQSFDLVVCNSVIEHVGSWIDMRTAAKEARRVGQHGWIQVPAFEFPIEQHFLLPFIHWLADTLQIWLLRRLHKEFRGPLSDDMFMAVFHTRPLTRSQLGHLFPETDIRSEWLLLPKSHVATWTHASGADA
ncbi:class I SAM-dependent methyltransferase [Pandoraea anhela]|uniref:Methyltransferase type 11 domain-containing protein n=1 Tax=Pandoraea anhela TaxID=2508295 RepID=A0A5E4WGF9_9BURK|nr:class I SAM-dependent methyltransferase [Pandoraea anhela]VVE22155.1 hypothetical protein PAN31108_03186 [Pandoraea anhela]